MTASQLVIVHLTVLDLTDCDSLHLNRNMWIKGSYHIFDWLKRWFYISLEKQGVAVQPEFQTSTPFLFLAKCYRDWLKDFFGRAARQLSFFSPQNKRIVLPCGSVISSSSQQISTLPPHNGSKVDEIKITRYSFKCHFRAAQHRHTACSHMS